MDNFRRTANIRQFSRFFFIKKGPKFDQKSWNLFKMFLDPSQGPYNTSGYDNHHYFCDFRSKMLTLALKSIRINSTHVVSLSFEAIIDD